MKSQQHVSLKLALNNGRFLLDKFMTLTSWAAASNLSLLVLHSLSALCATDTIAEELAV